MPIRLRYPEFAPEGIAHMRALEHYLNATTALPAVLLELVRLRVSLRNGCAFCIGQHTGELGKHNEPASRIAAVEHWPDSDAFTPRERSALAWADSVTEIQTRQAADSDYETVSEFFQGKDLVDLTMAVASINAWNRLSIAFRAEWDSQRAGKPALRSADEPQRDPLAGVAGGEAAASAPSAADTADARSPAPTGTAVSPHKPRPARGDAPRQDIVDDDGGKVAEDGQ